MSEESVTKGGFSYFVNDEQLESFRLLTPLQRLRWVDDARRFTLMARTPETTERQERLRFGKQII
jgi:hypothetical protein